MVDLILMVYMVHSSMMINQNVKLLAVKMGLAVHLLRTEILERGVMHAAMFLTASQHQLRSLLKMENQWQCQNYK